MPTTKRRISVTLPKGVAVFLKQLALRDDVPESTKAAQMIEMAMEIEEDLYLSKIADERSKLAKGTMTAKEFWSKVL